MLPTELRAATRPVPKSLSDSSVGLNPDSHRRQQWGTMKHPPSPIHHGCASLRADNGEAIAGNGKRQSHATSSTGRSSCLRIKGPCSVTSLLPLQTEPSAIEQESQSLPNVQKYLVELLKLICYIKSCTAVECNKFHLPEVFSAILHFFGEPGSYYSLK